MTYGLRVDNGLGILQIDSDRLGYSGIEIIDSGTGSSITGIGANDVIFARVTPAVGTRTQLGLNRSGSSATIVSSYQGATLNADWILCRRFQDQTPSSSGYGLQVYNATGDLAFDSNLYTGNGGITITNIFPPSSFIGNQDSPGDRFTTDLSTYVDLTHSRIADFGNGGTFAGYYFYNQWVSSGGLTFNGIHWLYFSFVPGLFTTYLPNWGHVITAAAGESV